MTNADQETIPAFDPRPRNWTWKMAAGVFLVRQTDEVIRGSSNMLVGRVVAEPENAVVYGVQCGDYVAFSRSVHQVRDGLGPLELVVGEDIKMIRKKEAVP